MPLFTWGPSPTLKHTRLMTENEKNSMHLFTMIRKKQGYMDATTLLNEFICIYKNRERERERDREVNPCCSFTFFLTGTRSKNCQKLYVWGQKSKRSTQRNESKGGLTNPAAASFRKKRTSVPTLKNGQREITEPIWS